MIKVFSKAAEKSIKQKRKISKMENNKIQAVYDRLTTDQAFADELKKFFENKKIESAADEVALLVEFANSQGYDVTADDVQAFAEKQYKALSEEELEKINAAGAGGFCIIVGAGWGWSESVSIFKCNCSVIGAGIGPGWKEVDAEAAKRESEEFSKKKARGCAKIY